ncbi:MAG: hypothetical protein ACLPS1_20805, partial [Streptosporangiaceae bacterium]
MQHRKSWMPTPASAGAGSFIGMTGKRASMPSVDSFIVECRLRLGTQFLPCPGSGGSDSSSLVDRSGPMANEFWMSDRQWAA